MAIYVAQWLRDQRVAATHRSSACAQQAGQQSGDILWNPWLSHWGTGLVGIYVIWDIQIKRKSPKMNVL
jgi:hypothetical protein